MIRFDAPRRGCGEPRGLEHLQGRQARWFPGFVGLACTVGKLTVGKVTKPMPEIWLQRRRYRHGLHRHC